MKNTFEEEFLFSLKTLDFCHYYKVPSPPPRSKMTRFYTPRPYDFFLLKDGIFCALELKYTNKDTAYPLSKFPKYQLEGLRQARNHGGLAIVVINIRKRNPRQITAYAFDFEDIEALIREGKASIPKAFLLSGYQLPRERIEKGRYIWRVDLLFQHFWEKCFALTAVRK